MFHADPPPGNLMWWKDRISLLDFGMAGAVDAKVRAHFLVLLMALWKENTVFLSDGRVARSERSGCASLLE